MKIHLITGGSIVSPAPDGSTIQQIANAMFINDSSVVTRAFDHRSGDEFPFHNWGETTPKGDIRVDIASGG